MTRFDTYEPGDFYDEMFAAPRRPRPQARLLEQRIQSLPAQALRQRQQAAEQALLQMGITFNVYGDEGGTEKIFPFDIIPRIIDTQEWDWIERGLKQRIQALNRFIDDVYHEQKIVKDHVVPEELIRSASGFRPACVGLDPPQGVWCHITEACA